MEEKRESIIEYNDNNKKTISKNYISLEPELVEKMKKTNAESLNTFETLRGYVDLLELQLQEQEDILKNEIDTHSIEDNSVIKKRKLNVHTVAKGGSEAVIKKQENSSKELNDTEKAVYILKKKNEFINENLDNISVGLKENVKKLESTLHSFSEENPDFLEDVIKTMEEVICNLKIIDNLTRVRFSNMNKSPSKK